MKKITSVVVLSCIVALNAAPALASVGAKNAAYHGGTITTFAGANDPVEGTLNLTRPDALVLTATAKDYRGREVVIPYASIVSLEYGQKAGRRVGAAVAGTVLLGPIGLVSLFSKKRKHFLTIEFTDGAGVAQVGVFELGKDMVRTTLSVVQTRSGKTLEYQDDEAKKSAK